MYGCDSTTTHSSVSTRLPTANIRNGLHGGGRRAHGLHTNTFQHLVEIVVGKTITRFYTKVFTGIKKRRSDRHADNAEDALVLGMDALGHTAQDLFLYCTPLGLEYLLMDWAFGPVWDWFTKSSAVGRFFGDAMDAINEAEDWIIENTERLIAKTVVFIAENFFIHPIGDSFNFIGSGQVR